MTPQLMTQQQRKHLAILALHCHRLPPDYTHFSMKAYASRKEFGGKSRCDNWGQIARAIDTNACGTTACFAGHGPLAGIAPLEAENWDPYVKRCFTGEEGADMATSHPYWEWLFSEYWPSSLPEAVKRAAWLLEKGGPPKYHDHEGWDEDKEEYTTSMEVYDEEAWEQFTPNLTLLEQIASGAGEEVTPTQP